METLTNTPWQKVPIFAGLTTDAFEFLASRARESDYRPGERIATEGDHGNTMFVIRSGEVRVWKAGADGEIEIARLGSGDFCGEMCILETLPRVASIDAVTPTHVNKLSSIAFYQFYRSMPDQYGLLILNIARDLSRRLRRMDQEFVQTTRFSI
jgi:CRP-like cAMP-binding protein